MRKVMVFLALLMGIAPAFAGGLNPSAGGVGGFVVTVTDIDIGNSAFELMTADSGFTQMASDTSISVIYLGDPGDTARVHITGLYPNRGPQASDSLKYRSAQINGGEFKVAGGDTVVSDSVFHAFEAAYLDAPMDAALIVFSTGPSVRAAILDTIKAGDLHSPIAHRLFGQQHRRPTVDRVTFANGVANALTYELRVYPDATGDLDYTTGYYVACGPLYIASGGDPQGCDFKNGLALGPKTFIAAFAKGAADNLTGTVTIEGSYR